MIYFTIGFAICHKTNQMLFKHDIFIVEIFPLNMAISSTSLDYLQIRYLNE